MAFPFSPDLRYIAHLDNVPRERFSALPDHPAQRRTDLHAVNLAASGVLDVPLDQHREVAAILVGDPDKGITIEQMIAEFAEDPWAALTAYGHKLNGHTRDYLWQLENGLPVPDTLRMTVYAAADSEVATQGYRAVDSLTAVKGRKDMMQSTLRVAGIAPTSHWLQNAGQLGTALDLALDVLCGSQDYRTDDIRAVLRQQQSPSPAELKMQALLPHLSAVTLFKETLLILDALNPSHRLCPMGVPFIAGYLSILHRDPGEGRKFIEALQDQPGVYANSLMDSFYAIKKVADEVLDPRAMLKTTGVQRTAQLLTCTLNAYEGWRGDTDFKADKFPITGSIINRFNPILRKPVDALARAATRAKVKERERRTAERRRQTELRRPQPVADLWRQRADDIIEPDAPQPGA